MSIEEGMSLEDMVALKVSSNVSTKVYVGKVKERNDMSLNFLSGTWTSFHYKEPFVYEGGKYSDVSVVSVMADENTARTGVWAIPSGLHAGDERELEKFRQIHKPYQLPEIHNLVVEEVEKIHYDMYEKRIRVERRI